jgi:hypothetical protein
MKVMVTVLFIALFGVALVGLFFFASRTTSRFAPPGSLLMWRVTPTGCVVMGIHALLLTTFAAARTLEPNGPLGFFLESPQGTVAAVVATVVGMSIVGSVFASAGKPLFIRDSRDGV